MLLYLILISIEASNINRPTIDQTYDSNILIFLNPNFVYISVTTVLLNQQVVSAKKWPGTTLILIFPLDPDFIYTFIRTSFNINESMIKHHSDINLSL